MFNDVALGQSVGTDHFHLFTDIFGDWPSNDRTNYYYTSCTDSREQFASDTSSVSACCHTRVRLWLGSLCDTADYSKCVPSYGCLLRDIVTQDSCCECKNWIIISHALRFHQQQIFVKTCQSQIDLFQKTTKCITWNVSWRWSKFRCIVTLDFQHVISSVLVKHDKMICIRKKVNTEYNMHDKSALSPLCFLAF